MLEVLIGILVVGYGYSFFVSARMARKICGELADIYAAPHVYSPVDPADLPSVPADGYQKMGQELRARGFQTLGAFEDRTMSRVYPELRTYFEAYTEDAGAIFCGTYHVSSSKFQQQVVDVESIFDNGTFLVTTNAAFPTVLDLSPRIERQVLAGQPSPRPLLEAHRLALEKAQAAGKQPRPTVTQADLLHAMSSFSRLECEYRQSVGFLKPKEWSRMTAGLVLFPGVKFFIPRLFRYYVRAHQKQTRPA